MSLLKEFRNFAVKGNMFEMAIGIIIGVAFNAIVNSLVKDIIMPIFGYIVGGVNFKDLMWVLSPEVLDVEGNVLEQMVAIKYGMFIHAIIDFLIIAFSIFMVVKLINRMKRKSENVEDKSAPTPKDIELLTEIRDGIVELNKKQS